VKLPSAIHPTNSGFDGLPEIDKMNILGIESSCDETAAAIVADGSRILSSVIASQVQVHHPYGGVVPELASRHHVEAIVPVVHQAIAQAGLTAADVHAVAATQGPGLIGSLLVGFSFAKAFAFARALPWIGIDHLRGHLQSVLLSDHPPAFPFVALLASGGHTGIYHCIRQGVHHLLGQTRDDAAGEAYDKVAKMLGLGYPGGAVIDRLAQKGDPTKVVFKRPFLDKTQFDFSFSGIKSAVHRHIRRNPLSVNRHSQDIAAGFQEAVVDVLVHKLVYAAQVKQCRSMAVVGGVAANRHLRSRLAEAAKANGLQLHVPPLSLCGDNAAMIAAAAYHDLKRGDHTPLDADVYSRHPRH
jgi:N6-L-threonylcarbamoyladenine synthase